MTEYYRDTKFHSFLSFNLGFHRLIPLAASESISECVFEHHRPLNHYPNETFHGGAVGDVFCAVAVASWNPNDSDGK